MRLGPWEIALIVMIVVILFGAKKIPEIMRGLGLGVKEFKSGLREDDNKSDDKPAGGEEKTDDKGNTKDGKSEE